MKVVMNGLLTGLILQTAIGPVFFFIMNLTLQKSLYDGLIAVIAVTLADYVYIAFSIFGVGKLLEKKKIKKIFGIISSIILIIFGTIIIKNMTVENVLSLRDMNSRNIFASFSSTFFLTISSPMTIVWYTSLFTTKAVQYNYSKRELVVFGFSVGLATLLFMGISVVIMSVIKTNIPIMLIRILNLSVGVLLVIYGIFRLKNIFKITIRNDSSERTIN